EAAVRAVAERIGYPVMLKPAAGGGGKGMRIVRSPEELAGAYRGATGEGRTSFGRSELLVEKLIEHARHVEMQLLADDHGRVLWLGERDCSVQRRHQKLIEETPGPSVGDDLRRRIGDAAVRIARASEYRNAGTAEFLVAPDGSFTFLEMNTRLQVEHPVTELVTGLDLVALQFAVAAGEPLPFEQHDLARRGAAIELRVTAEDPHAGFLPAGGTVSLLREASGPGVRVDSSLYPGMAVPTEYDPLLAKIAVWGPDRDAALRRARRAVRETLIGGVTTTLPFHAHVLAEADFSAGRYDTDYVAEHWPPPLAAELDGPAAAAAAYALVLGQAATASRITPVSDSVWARAGREEALR
ncbi:MAG: acetyl-CoA carboxylase biotin carboxylase subunit, partial [Candidatus Limnocylindria bacterium]